jgi:hypothetical protein
MRCVYGETGCFSILGNELDLNKLRKTPTSSKLSFSKFFLCPQHSYREEEKEEEEEEEESHVCLHSYFMVP